MHHVGYHSFDAVPIAFDFGLELRHLVRVERIHNRSVWKCQRTLKQGERITGHKKRRMLDVIFCCEKHKLQVPNGFRCTHDYNGAMERPMHTSVRCIAFVKRYSIAIKQGCFQCGISPD